ncbi:hypothetical protein PMAYCL1PPCAC_30517 [Pristionchus mayeri]|uniref:Uncharacterized protein n=1 Tax=Pristionchus mayeri TaxID=1317129 RepID=A0AAN5DDQ7_9BILA|nr:hypothetical protein PMAYCL1PPCAC_30517 [Pristionchus mayeri]
MDDNQKENDQQKTSVKSGKKYLEVMKCYEEQLTLNAKTMRAMKEKWTSEKEKMHAFIENANEEEINKFCGKLNKLIEELDKCMDANEKVAHKFFKAAERYENVVKRMQNI